MKTITRSEPAINPVVTDCLVYWAVDLFVAGLRVGFVAPIVPAPGGNVSAFRRIGVWALAFGGARLPNVRTRFAGATGSLANQNVFCHDGRRASQRAIRLKSMLAQTAAFFGGLPVENYGSHSITARQAQRRNTSRLHKSQVLCGSDLDVREPRPTTLHPFSLPSNRKPCMINHNVDIRP